MEEDPGVFGTKQASLISFVRCLNASSFVDMVVGPAGTILRALLSTSYAERYSL